MKATEQHFPVALFIMLYKVVVTFESVDEILKCAHSCESYRAALSCGAVYYAVILALSLWMKSLHAHDHSKAIEQYFPVVLFIIL